MDLCPNIPENYNRFLDTDGCPDDPFVRDFDQDGISNSIDLCPNVFLKLTTTFEDTDGCPDSVDTIELFSYQLPDNDNDGVDDRWDQCLDESENYNGFADTDGCPDVDWNFKYLLHAISSVIDSDDDAIPDDIDLCPTSPERYNGYFDD